MSVSFDSAETAGDWEDITSDTVVYYTPLSPSLPHILEAYWMFLWQICFTGGVREGGWPPVVYAGHKSSIN